MHTRLYRNGVLEKEGFPVEEVSDHVADPENVVWFDLCAPSPEQLAVISEELGLHELAIEDVLSDHERPKVDVYDHHLFVTVYGLYLEAGRIVPVEVDVFVTKNALVTVRENDRFDLGGVLRRWDSASRMACHGVTFLLHGLLDHVVDQHFDLVQELDGQVEAMEESLFAQSVRDGRALQQSMYLLRKDTTKLRRVTFPMREVIGTLLRRDEDLVADPAMKPYYEDVYDHVLRVTEWVESIRDMLANVRETRLSQQGFRLNEIMKRVTSWAAIIAVPTAITGFYGQNVPYPGSGTPLGFWTSTVLVALASAGLYGVFKKKDWL
ncbi:Magnesium and cobalt transport protein CorA [[Actinomadura] parvosata subsp. kistnae]|uniref:magnesium transporter CorA family protein n=1 Tax=[Actinomadura] parvosata TaxID=1955412 RepID=UPI000D2ABF66|nr:magnesium transporter CorA family protein [Nonomuraea sp. ATCC 55076]SPL99549.1 Magnesium and cobalt transport protein CorA [Actinomadura parvosata subsp. kistnae]